MLTHNNKEGEICGYEKETPLLGMMIACPANNRVTLELWRANNTVTVELLHIEE